MGNIVLFSNLPVTSLTLMNRVGEMKDHENYIDHIHRGVANLYIDTYQELTDLSRLLWTLGFVYEDVL